MSCLLLLINDTLLAHPFVYCTEDHTSRSVHSFIGRRHIIYIVLRCTAVLGGDYGIDDINFESTITSDTYGGMNDSIVSSMASMGNDPRADPEDRSVLDMRVISSFCIVCSIRMLR
jgi:hypothetical protein